MKKSPLFLTVLLVIAIVTPVCAQDTYTLKYRFDKGATLRYQENIKGMMTQEVMGQEMKIPMEMENTNRMVIEDVLKDGNISIVASYDAFFLKIKSDMIDTTGNVDAIIGKRKRTVINPLGTVIRSEVIDTIEQRDVSTFTSPGGLLQVLPEKPVSTGDTWTATRTDKGTAMGENGETKTHMTYTFVGATKRNGREVLKITYTGKSEISGSMNQMGMQLAIEGSGTVSGAFYFDNEKGVNVEENTKTEMNTVISMSGQDAMSFTGTQVMDMTKKLLDK